MATTLPAAAPVTPVTPARPAAPARVVSDTVASALRVLLAYRRSPGLLVASFAVPVVMVVVFGYVFGSAMQVPGGGNYREFLIPGLFVTVAVNGLTPTMIGTARDAGRGITDRLRSMPVSRTGLLLGLALADLVVGICVLIPLTVVGLAVGWRIRDGLAHAAVAYALLVLFRFTMTWVGMFLGLLAGSEETAGQLAVLTFPVAMVTNVFVPTGGMPGWLRTVADCNPISTVVAACREQFGNPSSPGSSWPMQHPVVAALLWSAGLLLIFVPLAVRRYSSHGR
ncbi:ABC transporter permease [Kitasatospora kazusensis]|uniref:Transport permease protein n=1 Tax=Kitasatospora kazusensis TaxID=407974 RepID=A0ABN2ZHE1_9ACTN